MIKRDNGELVQERIELSRETTGYPETQEDEDRLDQHKVFGFDELGGHSQVKAHSHDTLRQCALNSC